MNPWFYVDSESQRHQVTEEQLQSLAAAGVLRPDSLVWTVHCTSPAEPPIGECS